MVCTPRLQSGRPTCQLINNPVFVNNLLLGSLTTMNLQ